MLGMRGRHPADALMLSPLRSGSWRRALNEFSLRTASPSSGSRCPSSAPACSARRRRSARPGVKPHTSLSPDVRVRVRPAEAQQGLHGHVRRSRPGTLHDTIPCQLVEIFAKSSPDARSMSAPRHVLERVVAEHEPELGVRADREVPPLGEQLVSCSGSVPAVLPDRRLVALVRGRREPPRTSGPSDPRRASPDRGPTNCFSVFESWNLRSDSPVKTPAQYENTPLFVEPLASSPMSRSDRSIRRPWRS